MFSRFYFPFCIALLVAAVLLIDAAPLGWLPH